MMIISSTHCFRNWRDANYVGNLHIRLVSKFCITSQPNNFSSSHFSPNSLLFAFIFCICDYFIQCIFSQIFLYICLLQNVLMAIAALLSILFYYSLYQTMFCFLVNFDQTFCKLNFLTPIPIDSSLHFFLMLAEFQD